MNKKMTESEMADLINTFKRIKNRDIAMDSILKDLKSKDITDAEKKDLREKYKDLVQASGIKHRDTFRTQFQKGGEVKKYMGGGSVHKKKNKMLTTKGWGASRKT